MQMRQRLHDTGGTKDDREGTRAPVRSVLTYAHDCPLNSLNGQKETKRCEISPSSRPSLTALAPVPVEKGAPKADEIEKMLSMTLPRLDYSPTRWTTVLKPCIRINLPNSDNHVERTF